MEPEFLMELNPISTIQNTEAVIFLITRAVVQRSGIALILTLCHICDIIVIANGFIVQKRKRTVLLGQQVQALMNHGSEISYEKNPVCYTCGRNCI